MGKKVSTQCGCRLSKELETRLNADIFAETGIQVNNVIHQRNIAISWNFLPDRAHSAFYRHSNELYDKKCHEWIEIKWMNRSWCVYFSLVFFLVFSSHRHAQHQQCQTGSIHRVPYGMVELCVSWKRQEQPSNKKNRHSEPSLMWH